MTPPLIRMLARPRAAAIARVAAYFLTFCLFTVGSLPRIGEAFPGVLHWAAHLATYALIAFAFDLGYARQPAILIALFVAAIGAVHEAVEIRLHHHAFEYKDVMVNAVGALVGVAMRRVTGRSC